MIIAIKDQFNNDIRSGIFRRRKGICEASCFLKKRRTDAGRVWRCGREERQNDF